MLVYVGRYQNRGPNKNLWFSCPSQRGHQLKTTHTHVVLQAGSLYFLLWWLKHHLLGKVRMTSLRAMSSGNPAFGRCSTNQTEQKLLVESLIPFVPEPILSRAPQGVPNCGGRDEPISEDRGAMCVSEVSARSDTKRRRSKSMLAPLLTATRHRPYTRGTEPKS